MSLPFTKVGEQPAPTNVRMVTMCRAGVGLDRHSEYRRLQACYELGARQSSHQEAGLITGMFGYEEK